MISVLNRERQKFVVVILQWTLKFVLVRRVIACFHSLVFAATESLSNYDGNTNENVTQKTNFTFLKLLRYNPN